MSNFDKPFILVDGSSYLYRAFHALPALANSKGIPTGAIYGVINMLKRLLADYHPEYMAVVFDAKGKTFRDELYEDYKATRTAMPDELARQIEPIHHIIKALGLPLIMIEGVEADDVIGTLAIAAKEQGIQTLISTGDKDLAQLVSAEITLINTMSNTLYTIEKVIEKFGVPPESIIDYLALVGDSSDNIPGVPNVGPKTAAKWLQQYQSLDNIIKHAAEISGKVGENLRASLTQIPLAKSLATIKCDVKLPFDYHQLKIKNPDKKALIDLYKEMEFKSWLAELLEESQENNAAQYSQYKIILTKKELQNFIGEIKDAKIFAFDIQTNERNSIHAALVGVAIAIAPGQAAYIPCGHVYPDAPNQLSKDDIILQLKPVFEDALLTKIAQNMKYNLQILLNNKVSLKGPCFDVMLESYILDSTGNRHDINSLALKYLGHRALSYEDIAGKGVAQKNINEIDLQKASTYAAEYADITLRLHQLLWSRLQEENGIKNVFANIEMPLLFVLAEIERYGVLIDPEKLKKQGKELEKRLQELEKDAFNLAGQSFNLNSPKQLQEILFQKLNLPILQKTPTGQPSTADPVLQELAVDFALPRTIIEYRSLSKLISTYTNRLVEQIHPRTERVHTFYNQTGTSTGRLSSSDPNLQNIPIRSVEGRKIRQAFIAPKNYKLISADYSQIELRIMAHISEDKGLLYAFENNLDIHQATAAEVWETPIDQVTQEMRRNAKAINFGLIYGMSAFGLTKQLGIDRHAAQSYIDKYFARYPGVKHYMDNTRKLAKEKGYVETLWGRRLYIPDINASQIPRQKAAERAAINAPLQGSAADIIKLAMIQIDQWLKTTGLDARMIMQVHDELVFEAREEQLPQIIEGVRQHMSSVAKLRVPLIVAIGIGDNWDDASQH